MKGSRSLQLNFMAECFSHSILIYLTFTKVQGAFPNVRKTICMAKVLRPAAQF
jgi:hypothetical protein